MIKLIQMTKGEDMIKKANENIINKSFDTISKKIDILKFNLELRNSEIELDKTIHLYDKLSKNEMSFEEKYMFANYLLNLYNKAEKHYHLKDYFSLSYELDNAISLMKSSDINEKVIGIDNFISIMHESGFLLINILTLKIEQDYDIDEKNFMEYIKWQRSLEKKFINKLNLIRNRIR